MKKICCCEPYIGFAIIDKDCPLSADEHRLQREADLEYYRAQKRREAGRV